MNLALVICLRLCAHSLVLAAVMGVPAARWIWSAGEAFVIVAIGGAPQPTQVPNHLVPNYVGVELVKRGVAVPGVMGLVRWS